MCIRDSNLDEITEPLLACPNDPDDIKPLSEVQKTNIDEVFIGSCMTNIGHYRAAAKILENSEKINTRLWICPPTRMDEEVLNIQVRKFLKKVGIQSQREIEQAVKDHLKKGSLLGTEKLNATMLLEVPEIDLKVSIDGKIEIE